MKNSNLKYTLEPNFIEINQRSNYSRNSAISKRNTQIPFLNFKSHLIYPQDEINSFGYTINNDYLAKTNNNCLNKRMNNIDNYASTKIDSKSIGSKVVSSSRCRSRDRDRGHFQANKKQKSAKETQSPFWKTDKNVGTRLYNFGFYIKKKIETQKRDEEDKMIKRMKPKTNKSLMIEWDSPLMSLKRPIDTNQEKNKILSKQQNDGYNYQPSLNKHSLTIAKKLETSNNRLTKKRKRYKSTNAYQTYKASFELSYDYNSLSQYNNISNHSHSKPPKSKNTPKRIQSLYTNAMNQLKKRTVNYENNKQLKDDEYKLFPFNPSITHYSMSTYDNNEALHKQFSPERHYLNQIAWKNRLDKNNQMKRDKKEIDNLSKCTFSPKIAPLSIANDEELILKNLSQMNEFIAKRRTEINKQRETEEYRKKRFFENNKDFQIKTTQPKEFYFHPKNEKMRCCGEITKKNLEQNNKAIIYKTVTIRKENSEIMTNNDNNNGLYSKMI